MACTACHSPHGSTAPAQLVKNTVNETCTSCHRRIPRSVPLGAPAGDRGLQQLSQCARVRAAGASQVAPAVSLPDVSRGRGSSLDRQYAAGITGRQLAERLSARRRLRQLSLADTWLESSVGPRIHAVGAHHEIEASLPSPRVVIRDPRGTRVCDRVGRRAGRGHERLEMHPMSLYAGLQGGNRSGCARRQRRECELRALYRSSITTVRMRMPRAPDNIAAMTAPMRTTISSTSDSPRGRVTSRAAARGAMICE